MKSFKPLLQFEAGLFITSVALVAAAFSAMKDAWGVEGWKLPLLSFTAWMAVTIVAATATAFYLQIRRWWLEDDDAKWFDAAVALLPVIPGVCGALQLIRLAWCTAGAPLFW